MTLLQPIILGIIQGITEFLPISSSGHLIIVPYFFNWDLQDLSFDVALHFGTALAVLTYFSRDWKKIFSSQFTGKSNMLIVIIAATIPVGLAGILLEDIVQEIFRSPVWVAFMLILVSGVMWLAEKTYRPKKEKGFKDIFIISLSQIIALIPGTSRSGITISTGMFLGKSREESARISFLLATPIIIGAALVKAPDLINGAVNIVSLIIGVATSFVVGLLSIKFLLAYVKKNSLMLFVIYRVLLGISILFFVVK